MLALVSYMYVQSLMIFHCPRYTGGLYCLCPPPPLPPAPPAPAPAPTPRSIEPTGHQVRVCIMVRVLRHTGAPLHRRHPAHKPRPPGLLPQQLAWQFRAWGPRGLRPERGAPAGALHRTDGRPLRVVHDVLRLESAARAGRPRGRLGSRRRDRNHRCRRQIPRILRRVFRGGRRPGETAGEPGAVPLEGAKRPAGRHVYRPGARGDGPRVRGAWRSAVRGRQAEREDSVAGVRVRPFRGAFAVLPIQVRIEAVQPCSTVLCCVVLYCTDCHHGVCVWTAGCRMLQRCPAALPGIYLLLLLYMYGACIQFPVEEGVPVIST